MAFNLMSGYMRMHALPKLPSTSFSSWRHCHVTAESMFALQLAVQIGSNAIDMVKRGSGRFLIKALMRIAPVDRACREIMSNVCCHVAHSLEQSIIPTVVSVRLEVMLYSCVICLLLLWSLVNIPLQITVHHRVE